MFAQNAWQFVAMLELADFSGYELRNRAVENSATIGPGEPRGVKESVDVRMVLLDRATEGASGRMISRVHRVCRGAEAQTPWLPEIRKR